MSDTPTPPPEYGPPSTPAGPGATSPNRTPLIVGALVALVDVVVIAILMSGGGDNGASTDGGDGLTDALSASLKNAATAAESYATENNGSYEGFDTTAASGSESAGVTITGVDATFDTYCIEAVDDSGTTAHFNSESMVPEEGPCS